MPLKRQASTDPSEWLAMREQGEIRLLPIDQIVWIEADDHYIVLHCESGQHRIRRSLSSTRQELRGKGFLQISRFALVAVSQIQTIIPRENGDYSVTLSNGARLSLTRRFWPSVKRTLHLG